ncbi:MAG: AAA family ATPase, partial [Bacteroidota bacterium]
MAEIVIVAGPPGGGKSTVVKPLIDDRGYFRINRDELGGTLKPGGIAYQTLLKAFQDGKRDFVLDNIYATRESRATVIALGKTLGLPVRCIWLET